MASSFWDPRPIDHAYDEVGRQTRRYDPRDDPVTGTIEGASQYAREAWQGTRRARKEDQLDRAFIATGAFGSEYFFAEGRP